MNDVKTHIALVSPNLNKFSETFIAQQVYRLTESGFYTHKLYGGNIPTMNADGTILTDTGNLYKLGYKVAATLFPKYRNSWIKYCFRRYLQKHKIRLVFAEFGPTAADILDLCKAEQIPVMVMFHGHDAWNKDVLEKYSETYVQLFNYASKVYGVSKSMCKQLEKLGSPPDKTAYLPAAVNADLFQYSDHSLLPPVYLGVGRFVNQKSPLILLLAFNEVLKTIPQARLILVGNHDEAPIYQAAETLVKALKIEPFVEFKGTATPQQVKDLMNQARVFVQHSATTPVFNDKEGTPVAIMEAMLCGLPVVSTRHEGISELIKTGENGVLVEEFDYVGMAQEMIKLATDNATVYHMGRKASESIRENERILKGAEILTNDIKEILQQ